MYTLMAVKTWQFTFDDYSARSLKKFALFSQGIDSRRNRPCHFAPKVVANVAIKLFYFGFCFLLLIFCGLAFSRFPVFETLTVCLKCHVENIDCDMRNYPSGKGSSQSFHQFQALPKLASAFPLALSSKVDLYLLWIAVR